MDDSDLKEIYNEMDSEERAEMGEDFLEKMFPLANIEKHKSTPKQDQESEPNPIPIPIPIPEVVVAVEEEEEESTPPIPKDQELKNGALNSSKKRGHERVKKNRRKHKITEFLNYRKNDEPQVHLDMSQRNLYLMEQVETLAVDKAILRKQLSEARLEIDRLKSKLIPLNENEH